MPARRFAAPVSGLGRTPPGTPPESGRGFFHFGSTGIWCCAGQAASASWKSPVDTPAGRELAGSASRLFVRRAHFGRIDEVKRIFSSAHPAGTFTGKFAQGIVDEGVGFGDQLLA